MAEMTKEECRDEFLGYIRTMVMSYKTRPNMSLTERLEGVAFGILCAIDGCAGLPPFVLAPQGSPDERKEAEEEELDWWPETPDVETDIGGGLHEEYVKRYSLRGDDGKPDDVG